MKDRTATDEQLRILKFWWLLELFSPQKVPDLGKFSLGSPNEQVVRWQSGEPLPWTNLSPPTSIGTTELVWSHTVYLGVYSLGDIYESLHNVFHDDADAYDERPPGRSACAGLLIDDKGQLVDDSSILSSALWAVGRAISRGPSDPRWAEGFESAQTSFAHSVADREAERIADFVKRQRSDASSTEGQDPPPPPIDGEFLHGLLQLAHGCSDLHRHSQLASAEIIIKSTAVSAKRAGESNESDFLNSFFLEDLVRVRGQVAEGELGDALNAYLSHDEDLPTEHRIDVRDSPSFVDAEASIEYLPKGRWPSEPTHHLALSQQFAVNCALGSLASTSGTMGVNGPPGTGKTTMLRDVLAGNVVERARVLASLPRAADAFTTKVHRWNTGAEHDAKIPQLRPELTGFEMIVASANNAAVENVSFEIPATDAIAERWRDEADYFSDIATFILQGGTRNKSFQQTTAAWGTIAARLGNKGNRKDFRNLFWFREKDPETKKVVEGGCLGVEETLRRWLSDREHRASWADAKNSFFQAEK